MLYLAYLDDTIYGIFDLGGYYEGRRMAWERKSIRN